MNVFKKIVGICVWCAKWSAIITAMLMTVMIFLQVIFRYVIGSSLSWSEELARYCFIWSVAMGTAIALKTRSHMGVELLVDNLPIRIRRYAVAIASFLSLIFYAILVIWGFDMTIRTMDQLSAALSLPMGYVYLCIPLSGIVLFICEIENSIQDLFGTKYVDTSVKGE